MPVAVEVANTRHGPARWKSRTGSAANANVVIHVPKHGLTCGSIAEKQIWVRIAIEIGERHRRRDPDIIDVFSTVKCGCIRDVGACRRPKRL